MFVYTIYIYHCNDGAFALWSTNVGTLVEYSIIIWYSTNFCMACRTHISSWNIDVWQKSVIHGYFPLDKVINQS